MGIYNCESTLDEAIHSILSQTYTNWELIMCDDCSTDETYQLAKSYADRYDNIILLKNEHNMGLPATLNHCLEYATAEYVARMDGDDLSLANRLEKEVSFLDSHPEYAIVSCPMIYFDETGDWGQGKSKPEPTKLDFAYSTPFCHAPCMMRRKDLIEVGNYTVKKSLRRGQDYYLWHKFYKAGYKGYNLQEPLYKMRDDRNAVKRRTMKTAIYGCKTQLFVMRNLGLPVWLYYRAFRHIFVCLIPQPIYVWLHKRKLKK